MVRVDELPRILFLRVPASDRAQFDGLPGTHTYVDELDSVHPSDHDLLVVFGADYVNRGDWPVLGFGVEHAGPYHKSYPRNNARHAHVSNAIKDKSLRALVQRSIVDVIADRPRSVWTQFTSSHTFGRATTENLDEGAHRLVQLGAEGATYALLAETYDGLVWALPDETTERRAWLVHVLRFLHTAAPDTFPAEPDWQAGAAWAPPELSTAISDLERQVADRERLIAEADARVEAAEQAVDNARRDAAAGPWRLLTAEGDELVAAVGSALRAFGFTVAEKDDEHHATHGRRLEDLLVTDPTAPDWESLVEVKGYSRGARVNDVAQVVGAPSTYFAADRGRAPASVWHVVNVERGVDPSARAVAIPNDKDLRALTDASGALIDTRMLFRAWCAVKEGLDTVKVRASLRSARTRWTWPEENG
ncbi:hypothetical protein [Cellulomonas palmilytica]|uniref:hypothetical protein n=1 Tax=Cellulomonas palmilytica TaxID=2608402 RepID=UPI001F20A0F7|nr:hypothetical protein [Cellulomonas palmilytica]UJP40791.1 hypothetical protein F1D97_04685 [Cellulomonas palmilytica]